MMFHIKENNRETIQIEWPLKIVNAEIYDRLLEHRAQKLWMDFERRNESSDVVIYNLLYKRSQTPQQIYGLVKSYVTDTEPTTEMLIQKRWSVGELHLVYAGESVTRLSLITWLFVNEEEAIKYLSSLLIVLEEVIKDKMIDTAVAPTENMPQQDLKPVTNIYMGDYVGGDKIGGDKVGSDKTTVGNISDSNDIAIGTGASANIGGELQGKYGNTAVPTPNDSSLTPEERVYLSKLLKILRQYFSQDDLKELYFELWWEYGQFESGGKDTQERALVERCFKEDRLNELVDLIAYHRPNLGLLELKR